MASRLFLIAAAAAALFGAAANMSDLTADSYQCCAGAIVCPSSSATVGCQGSNLIRICCPDGTSPSHSCDSYGLTCTCSQRCVLDSQIIINYSTNNGQTFATTAVSNNNVFSMSIGLKDFGLAGFYMSPDELFVVKSSKENENDNDPSMAVYLCTSTEGNQCYGHDSVRFDDQEVRICTGPSCDIRLVCDGHNWVYFRYDNENGLFGNKVTVRMHISRNSYYDTVCNPPTPSPTTTIRPPNTTVLPPNATVLPPNTTVIPPAPSPSEGDLYAPHSGLPTSSIVGIVLSVVIVVLAAALVTVIVLRKKRAAAASTVESDPLLQPKAPGIAPNPVSYN